MPTPAAALISPPPAIAKHGKRLLTGAAWLENPRQNPCQFTRASLKVHLNEVVCGCQATGARKRHISLSDKNLIKQGAVTIECLHSQPEDSHTKPNFKSWTKRIVSWILKRNLRRTPNSRGWIQVRWSDFRCVTRDLSIATIHRVETVQWCSLKPKCQ